MANWKEVNGAVKLDAGTGGATFAPLGLIHSSVTSAQTAADTNETDLWTYTLPAGTIPENAKGIRIILFGSFGATNNNKTVKTYFGATTMNTSGVVTTNNGHWQMTGMVLRTSATAQISCSKFRHSSNSVAVNIQTPAETLAGAIVIRLTGTNGTAAAGDIVFKGATVEVLT